MPENLAYACQSCNNFKYAATTALDPVTGLTAALYDPRRDEWSAHFQWSRDEDMMLGLTATGRATIARLQLNRAGVVRMRRVLRRFALHPPAARLQ